MKIIQSDSVPAVCILWGDERALQDELLARIAGRLEGAEMYRFSGEDALEKTLEVCDTPSLFGAFKLVCISVEGDTSLWPRLAAYIADPSHTACLVVVSKHPPSGEFPTDDGHCLVIDCSRLQPREASAWLVEYARDAGKSLPTLVAERLLEASGRSLTAACAELEKLITYVGNSKQISLDDYEAVCHAAPHKLYQILDEVFNGRLAEALRICRGLVIQGESEEALFGLLASEVRLMHKIKVCKEASMSDDDIRKLLELQPFRYSRCLKQSNRFSPLELKQKLYELNELDAQQKRGFITPSEALSRAIMLLGRQRLR